MASHSIAGGSARGSASGVPPLDKERRPSKAASDRSVAQSLLEKTIDRVEELIDEESAALAMHRAIDLREFNNRKSQALLELTRVTRVLNVGPLDVDLEDRLKLLHRKLEANRSIIKMHLDAVREIASLVAGSIQEAESDGTYSQATRKFDAIR